MYGNGDLGDLDDGNYGGVAVSGEMMLPYDQVVMSNATAQSVSVMKQEMCSGREQSEGGCWGVSHGRLMQTLTLLVNLIQEKQLQVGTVSQILGMGFFKVL